MSSTRKLSVLAFASTVFASPPGYGGSYAHGHGYGHQHLHSSPAPYAYPNVNSTGSWGSTGIATKASSYTSASEAPSYSQSAPSYSQGGPETLTSTQFETMYHTVSYGASSGSATASAGGYGSDSSEACGQDVTVTTTQKVYVTVPPGEAPSSSPVNSYSSQPAPSGYGSSSAPSAPAYNAPSSSSTLVAPVSSSSAPAYSASSYSAPASSSSAASSYFSSAAVSSYSSSSPSAHSSLSAYTAINKGVGASSVGSTSASSSPSTGSSSGGKRGLAYNSADLTTCFDSSDEITWAYNWVSASAGLTGSLKFIPTLHDGSDTFTSVWNNEASASISSGSTTLFSFNEPDEPAQANMSPEAAAEAYIKYMNPFAGKAKLCAPSVSNGESSTMGLNWLQSFVTACAGKCHIDCYNVHWYSPPDSDAFKKHISQAIDIAGDKAVWVSEFGCTGASSDQVSTFLEDVMPWMDSNDSVAGYAYYMVSDGNLLTGTEPSTYGKTYMSYTG